MRVVSLHARCVVTERSALTHNQGCRGLEFVTAIDVEHAGDLLANLSTCSVQLPTLSC